MRQTLALFLDAYRELNARKMFWISIVLSALVVAVFCVIGINEKGWTILNYQVPSAFNTKIIPAASFYKFLFSAFGVNWWLNFFGLILALISTAGMFPDFIAGGSVDLYLSKPISRLRLFFTKYACGLTFAAFQVAVFSFACFIWVGVRGGSWDFKIFLAIPVTVLVFSYLYSVCVLLGLLTRSTIAAALLTLLVWLMIFGVHASESWTLMGKLAGEIETEGYRTQFASIDRQLSSLRARSASGDQSAAQEIAGVEDRKRQYETKKQASDPTRQRMATAHNILFKIHTLFPKTDETGQLLTRWLKIDTSEPEAQRLRERDAHRQSRGWLTPFQDRTEIRIDDSEVLQEVAAEVHSRSTGWVIGTSLGFEAVILLLAAWIFCRRDY